MGIRYAAYLSGTRQFVILHFRHSNWADCDVVFENYGSCKEAYNDIIKETISQGRKNHDVEVSNALLLALENCFLEHMENGIPKGLSTVKDLAHKMALTFGFDLSKRREAVLKIHKNGADFSFQTEPNSSHLPNIDFLEVISELSHKLSKETRKGSDTHITSFSFANV